MEVVGGIASILQLTKYVISVLTSLCETYDEAKSRPQRLQRQLDQVRSLHATVKEIEASPIQHQPHIVEQLQGLTSDIQLLKVSLEKIAARQKGVLAKRVLKTLTATQEHTRLDSILASIERDKSSLSLSILTYQSDHPWRPDQGFRKPSKEDCKFRRYMI